MALCEVVAAIAEAIESVRQPLTNREAFLLHVLKSMPLYRNVGKLDLWEYVYDQIAPKEKLTDTEKLMDDVLEFGRANMYSAFDPMFVRECYDRIVPTLTRAGIPLPTSPDLSGW
jgi:hypothetical protein